MKYRAIPYGYLMFLIKKQNTIDMQNNSVPKVSVLIPAYEEKYILPSLDALLNQRYPNFEIIVADNASTDSTSFLSPLLVL